MVENRVNNTDPVVQVRLRVMRGNFHGARHTVRLAAGFVCPDNKNGLTKGGSMTRARKISFKYILGGAVILLLLAGATAQAYQLMTTF